MHHSFLTQLTKNPEDFPSWLSEGFANLLPKTDDTVNPKKCRPLTCLTMTYKLLTSIITERIYVFMKTNDLFPIEQKGCRKESYGCKDQLLISQMIVEDLKSKHKFEYGLD